jgi:hypothetical protein
MGIQDGYHLVRAELFSGSVMVRGVKDFEHGTLCKAFSLDPCSYYFDLPSSFRGVGNNQSGSGGSTRGGRMIDGMIMGPGKEPIGKIIWMTGNEKFRDYNPQDASEFYRMGRH